MRLTVEKNWSAMWLYTVPAAFLLTLVVIAGSTVNDTSPLKSVVMIVALGAGLFGAFKVAARADVALVFLIMLVWGNISQVLGRFHGIPGIFHLALIAILVATFRDLQTRRVDPGKISLLWLPALAYTLFPLFSATRAIDPSVALENSAELMKAFILFFLVVLLVNSPDRLRTAIWSMAIASATLSMLGIVQQLTGMSLGEMGGFARVKHAQIVGDLFGNRLAGPIGDPGFFGQLLVLSSPPILSLLLTEKDRRMKLLALICLVLTMLGVGLTYTRGSMIVLLFVSVLSLFSFRLVRWRHVPLILASAALGLLLLSGNIGQRLATVAEAVPGHENSLHPDSSIELRWLFANTAVQMFADNPLTGVGSGNYSVNYDQYADKAGSDARHYGDADEGHFAHNLFLETAAETGLTGLFLLGALLISALWSAQALAARVVKQEPGLAISALALRNSTLAYLLTGMLLHGHFQRPVFIVIGLIAALASFPASPGKITDSGVPGR